ncbi:MAG TPA: glycosyltransferase family 2 protein [Bryobacteraceae bacterium]|jgi:glycosyltransferase involved in cell wall biosynthesis|nr:glycosyltransferase family 2 protein [Bryobacteraceae bacterium]
MLSVTPLVSVVTPTFNAGRYLTESIESVLGQDYPNIEYLLVDSYSTDDTQRILRNYEGRLRTIATPRLGPASAIHTGLTLARGSVLAWLNADDRYAPEAVRSALAVFQDHPEVDIVYGDADWIDEWGDVIRPYPTSPFSADILSRDCLISQPAAFFRTSAYKKCALDASLPVSFDYDLWIRMSALGCRFEYLPQRLACSRMHRQCLSFARRREVFEVSMDLLKRHYGYVPLSWIFGYLSYRWDGRDQFFEPLRFSKLIFTASVLLGIVWNRSNPVEAFRDIAGTAGRGLRRKLSRGFDQIRQLLSPDTAAEFAVRRKAENVKSHAVEPEAEIDSVEPVITEGTEPLPERQLSQTV